MPPELTVSVPEKEPTPERVPPFCTVMETPGRLPPPKFTLPPLPTCNVPLTVEPAVDTSVTLLVMGPSELTSMFPASRMVVPLDAALARAVWSCETSVTTNSEATTRSVNVFVVLSTPPPTVPPLSCTTTLMVAVPLWPLAGMKVNVPVLSIAGGALNSNALSVAATVTV